MDTVLVTGGAGFIGSCLVRQLCASQTVRVVNLDLLTYAGSRESLAHLDDNRRHTLIHGDIGDRELVGRILAEHQPTSLINLAAETHVDRSIDSPQKFVSTNVVGTFTLLEAAREYWRGLPPGRQERFRFLHVSSDEVFGSLGSTGSFNEESCYAPNSPYAASKAGSDHLVRAYHHTYGLPTLITNSSNNYGPYQFPEKLIPLMILNALEGEPLPVYGDGQQVRDWLFVEDHASAIRLVLDSGTIGETYCIGGNCERTNLDVVQVICDAVDRLALPKNRRPSRERIEFVADRPGHDRRYAIDCTKIRTQLGWQPETNFNAGIMQTVKWYAEHSGWVKNVTAGGYRRIRLGLGTDPERDC